MKKKTFCKAMALVLALVMMQSLMLVNAFAAGDYTFNNGVLTIHTAAGVTAWESDEGFSADDVTSLVIESAVTQIGTYAFQTCDKMKSVTFEGDIEVGGSAFADCEELETVIFEGESILKGGSFFGSLKIKTIRFDKPVSISQGAFGLGENKNTALEELVFPAGSVFETSSIFTDFDALKSVTFEGDISLGGGYFYNCDSLETIIFMGESIIKDSAFSYCPKIKKLRFDKKTAISGGAFSIESNTSNNSLEELVFPDGSSLAPNSFFHDFNALKSVVFKGDITLGGATFSNCDAIETVVFEGTSTVGGSAFDDCKLLKNVTFNKAATLSQSAFCCSETDPNTSMTKLVLPAGSSIDNAAFGYFKSLKTVVFGENSVQGSFMLPYCSALEEFIFDSATPPEFATVTFTNFEPSKIQILVPDADAYKAALAEDTGDNPNFCYNNEYVDCVKECKSLTFATNGGSAVDKIYNISGISINLADYSSKKDGFIFGGWYADNALTSRVMELILSENKTVYAKWITLTGIEIKTKPSNITLQYKSTASTDGLVVVAKYSDGSETDITNQVEVKDFDTAKDGDRTATVEFDGKTATFNYTVKFAWWQMIIRILLLGFLWY